MVTGGPAACIHMQGPYTTAASSEKDLILVQPIDVLGKEHIGKVVIVDPDDDAQEEFLRQVADDADVYVDADDADVDGGAAGADAAVVDAGDGQIQ